MERKFRIKGTLLDRNGESVAGLKVKAYDENGLFLASDSTSEKGTIDFECRTQPKHIKLVRHNKTISVKDLPDVVFVDGVIDLGLVIICVLPPAEWHIKGSVKDRMSGDPLQGLTVEVWDEDSSGSGKTFLDSLGEDITDAAGEFNVWFDSSAFARQGPWMPPEPRPDVLIKVKNPQGVVIHETPVDQNVSGSPHPCGFYCPHSGKTYTIEIDYVTVAITKVGPVDVASINASGRASYSGNDRPFGGSTTISGRIWGAKVDQWKLYYAEGFVDSSDAGFSGLGPNSPNPSGFNLIKGGTGKVWDGPIHTWDTKQLEGVHTALLVVWDQDGNEYHDTQLLFLHNQPITPAAQISSPAPGSTLSKAAGGNVEVRGTASDDYFLTYYLYWVGPTSTVLTEAGITYATAAHTQVSSGRLGDWDIHSLPEGPYCVRLLVLDRAILNDGADVHPSEKYNTLNITE